MKNLKYKKGFTLLELLIVISIIAILTAIVLYALSNARQKGGDGGVKANLGGSRAQADVFYNTNTANPLSYVSVCTNGAVGGVQGIGAGVLAAAKAGGLTTFVDDAASSSSQAVCNDDAGGSAWAAEVPLLQGGFWCVDSTNVSKYKATSGLTSGTDYVCG